VTAQRAPVSEEGLDVAAMTSRAFRPLGSLVVLAAAALVILLGWEGDAADPEVRRAGSVCEAQELKALAAEHPDVQIESPAEFDRPWPSLSACRSHEAAWDDEAPGPRQPIPFSHAHHAGRFQIECLYCHSGTDRARYAGMPSVDLCMGCHANFPAEYDELEGIRILKQHWEERTPIEWQQIHRLPEHVKFRHNRHIAAGVECQRCHGPVQEMQKLYLVPETDWWHYGMPARKLEMGWCVQCHNENAASVDCIGCHY
jgi:hypothetical protein